MTEENIQNSGNPSSEKHIYSSKIPSKKYISPVAKIIIFVAVSMSAYFGFKYFKIKEAVRLNAKTEVNKFEAIESEIFD